MEPASHLTTQVVKLYLREIYFVGNGVLQRAAMVRRWRHVRSGLQVGGLHRLRSRQLPGQFRHLQS